MRIAQRFSAGLRRVKNEESPVGTDEVFICPYGTPFFVARIPALKRRAILRSPSGTFQIASNIYPTCTNPYLNPSGLHVFLPRPV